jgi:hypothetical protein
MTHASWLVGPFEKARQPIKQGAPNTRTIEAGE